jgi:predicted ATPase
VRWHGRVGARLEAGYGVRAQEIAAELAEHFMRGRDTVRAVHYLLAAGRQAAQRSAHQEAVRHFTRGLELLTSLPETPTRAQQELDLQIALAPALIVTRGFAAPEVEAVYTRAQELCQQVGERPQLFTVLAGLRLVYYQRAEYQIACALGEQLLSLAQRVQDPALLLVAYQSLGVVLFALGELVPARAHLEQGRTLYDPRQHRSYAVVYGLDPGLVCLSYEAVVLWLLGYPAQALQRVHDTLTLGQALSHPFGLGYALNTVAWMHQCRREGQSTQERAEAALALAREHGFPFWVAWGTILRGWALAAQGQGEEGIAQLRQGLTAYQATGSALMRPHFLALLAEAYGQARQAEAGLTVLTEALAAVDKTGERWWEAETHRLKGELLLAQAGKRQKWVEAEDCFWRALEVARRQQAKSWELRAAVSLGRLWQRQGKRAEACELLTPIYGWFTEGFDTTDLQEARALLEALGGNTGEHNTLR